MIIKRIKIFLILIFAIAFFTSETHAQWVQTSGPAGIDINVLFKQGNTILAGTQAFGTYRSTNNGLSWVKSNIGIETNWIKSIVYLNGTFYAGSFTNPRGIFKSTDDGLTWTPVSGLIAGKSINTLAVKDNFIFAGTPYPDGGLYRSSDFGITWENLIPNSIIKLDYIFINGNSIMASEDNFIWYSSDNGTNWSLQYQFALGGSTSMAANGNTILSAPTSLRSTDNGISWNTSPSPGLAYALTFLNGVFYAGTTTGVYKSSDNGDSWTPSSSGISNGTVKSLLNDNINIYAALTNSLAGIYKSTDLGNSWISSSSGLEPASNVRSLIAKGPYVFAGMQFNGIYRTTDNGDKWSKLDTANILLRSAVVFDLCLKDSILFAGTNKGLFRSTNNGIKWTLITAGFPPGASSISVFSLAVSGNNLLAAVRTDVSLQSGIYYSTNEGLNWTLSNLSFGIVQAVGCSGGLTCLTVVATVGTLNGLYRSTDGGISWQSNIFNFNNPDVIKITGNGNKWMMSTLFTTFRSSNDGDTWIASPVPGGASFTFTQIGDNNIFIGNQIGMSRSTDWGISWESINSGFPSTNIAVNGSCANDRFLFAGTSDHAVWRRPLSDFGLTGVNKVNSVVPKGFILSQNYPNPFNPSTQINFSIPYKTDVLLKIFDIRGKEIKVLIDNKVLRAGTYNINWNSSGNTTGIYFYTLKAGNFLSTKKMILIK